MLKWSVIAYVAGLIVALLHLHYTHRRMLTELQSVMNECSNSYCYYCSSRRLECGSSRRKRDLSTQNITVKRRGHTEKHTFLHLVPAAIHSYVERDMTVLSWAVGHSQGAGFQVSGNSITVLTNGSYFIYSQVLYKDTTWMMGHVITMRLNGAETKLMKCVTSKPPNMNAPLNTCYTAGIHFLESGSVLELYVPRSSAQLITSPQATFMGIFRI